MVSALDERYQDAVSLAVGAGAATQVAALEDIGHRTTAVVTMSLSSFKEFISKETSLYSTYQLQVRANVRQATDPDNDRMRLAVDTSLYGTAADKITFAALSATGAGVASYGAISMNLREVAVKDRATVLEENSWTFTQTHNSWGKRPPPGYLSNWAERGKLVVAKLAHRLTSDTTGSALRDIILTQAEKRQQEDFLEVHIYGTFNPAAIESVSGSSKTSSGIETAELAWVKDKLASLKKGWFEQ